MSAFSRFFIGSPTQAQQLPTMTDSQQNIINSLLSQLGGPISSGVGNLQNILGGSNEAFSAFERPIMRQFNEQIIPSISERFAGLGGGSSSGFQQTLGRAAERLSETLGAQRAGLQSQALSQLIQLLTAGLSPQFEYQGKEGTQGLLPSLLAMLGMAATGGNSMGGMAGSAIGSGLSSAFRG